MANGKEGLEQFLRAAKERGAGDEFLVALLRQKGWPEKAVYQALGRIYEEQTGAPLPEPQSTLESAREAFYHLLAFGTLASWIFAIGSIWFELINTWVPDSLDLSNRSWAIRNVSWQIAAILVSFPVFVVATRSILKDMALEPDKAASGVRRWLTNIALLIAALVFIGDLVSVLAVFLQGELTARFLLKSFTVLVLSGGVFFYYTKGLNNREALPAQSWHRGFARTAAALIAITLLFGFWKTGSPARQRSLSQDSQRVQDLYTMASIIHGRYRSADPKSLPTKESLQELWRKDPVSQQDYDYLLFEGPKYQLCATFEMPSEDPANAQNPVWRHPAGRHCFALDASLQPEPAPFR